MSKRLDELKRTLDPFVKTQKPMNKRMTLSLLEYNWRSSLLVHRLQLEWELWRGLTALRHLSSMAQVTLHYWRCRRRILKEAK